MLALGPNVFASSRYFSEQVTAKTDYVQIDNHLSTFSFHCILATESLPNDTQFNFGKLNFLGILIPNIPVVDTKVNLSPDQNNRLDRRKFIEESIFPFHFFW